MLAGERVDLVFTWKSRDLKMRMTLSMAALSCRSSSSASRLESRSLGIGYLKDSIDTCSSLRGAQVPYGPPPCTQASSMYSPPPSYVSDKSLKKYIFVGRILGMKGDNRGLSKIQWKSKTDVHKEKVSNTVSPLIESFLLLQNKTGKMGRKLLNIDKIISQNM